MSRKSKSEAFRNLVWVEHDDPAYGHRTADLLGKPLEYWPRSKARTFRYDGVTYKHRDIVLFVKLRAGDRPPVKQVKAPKNATCAKCKHWSRGFGVTASPEDIYGSCAARQPPAGEDAVYTEQSEKCGQFSAALVPA